MASLFVLMITVNLDLLTRIANRFCDWLLDIVRTIFAGIDFFVPEESVAEEQQSLVPEMTGNYGESTAPTEAPEAFRFFIIAVGAIALLIGTVVLLYLIVKYGRIVLERRKKQTKETELETNGDIREKCGVEKKKRKPASWTAFLSEREKIRRQYRKMMLKEQKSLIGDQGKKALGYLTAKECCGKLKAEDLRVLYEQARYDDRE